MVKIFFHYRSSINHESLVPIHRNSPLPAYNSLSSPLVIAPIYTSNSFPIIPSNSLHDPDSINNPTLPSMPYLHGSFISQSRPEKLSIKHDTNPQSPTKSLILFLNLLLDGVILELNPKARA